MHLFLKKVAFFLQAILVTTSLLGYSTTAVTAANKNSRNDKTIVVCQGGNIELLKHKLSNYEKIISKYSKKYDVSEALIKAVITAESCFNANARSPKGAEGLMQLMPATASRFGVTNRFNPDLNIKAGTRYLKYLLEYYDDFFLEAIAAYNAGEGAVDKYKGIPPYKETRQYVAKVAALYQLYARGVKVYTVFEAGTVRRVVFNTISIPGSRFSPYKGRKKNIARGNCANRTGTRLRKSTFLQSGNNVWQRVYVAQKGDTLLRVTQKTGIHKRKIRQMNRLKSRSRLKEGQRLLVWECRK